MFLLASLDPVTYPISYGVVGKSVNANGYFTA